MGGEKHEGSDEPDIGRKGHLCQVRTSKTASRGEKIQLKTDFHKHLQTSNLISPKQQLQCHEAHNTVKTSRVSENNRPTNKEACDQLPSKTMETQRPAEFKHPASSIKRSQIHRQSKSSDGWERMRPE